MAGQKQVEDVPAGPADLGRMGAHANGRGDRIAARRLERALPFDLDHANPAHARQAQILVKAERGDVNLQFPGGFEDRRSQGHGDRSCRRWSRVIVFAQRLGMFDQFGGARALAGRGPRSDVR